MSTGDSSSKKVKHHEHAYQEKSKDYFSKIRIINILLE